MTSTSFSETLPVRWLRMAALLFGAIVLAAGCSSSEESDDAAEASTTTAATEATDDDTNDDAAADDTADADTEPDETEPETEPEPAATGPAVFDAAAPLNTDIFSPLSPGSHRFDQLGTEFSVTTEAQMWIQPNWEAFVVLTDPASAGPGDSDIVMTRLATLLDPADIDAPGVAGTDLDGWLAAAGDNVVVSDRQEVMIGDTVADRFDISVAVGATCDVEWCVNFSSNRVDSMGFDIGHTYRVWLLPQDGEQPIAVTAGASSGDDTWLDEATDVMRTVAFGPTMPSPIPSEGDLWPLGLSGDIPAGTVTLPIGPGLTFELTEEAYTLQTANFAAITAGEEPAENDIVLVTDSLGGPVSTVDEVIEQLELFDSFDVTDRSEIDTAGTTATRIEFEGSQSIQLFFGDNRNFDVWFAPAFGVMWLIDTDAGPLMITAEGLEDEAGLAGVLPRAETIIATLELG